MENGVVSAARAPVVSRASSHDSLGALLLGEGAISERVILALPALEVLPENRAPSNNAFGIPFVVEHKVANDVSAVLAALREFERYGVDAARVALVAPAEQLAAARAVLVEMASRRIGTVVHALASSAAEAFALADLGWGVLVAASAEESLDLTLVARRAAEDCGTPFIVVHERSSVRHVEPVAPPTPALCETYIGPASTRLRKAHDPAHPRHADVTERAFAERVPFALGSAMRELETLTGRHHDTVERRPLTGDPQVAFVGIGALGDSLLASVERLRATTGHDIGAVRVVSLRPFPGPRLVKMLGRALAVSVVESCDDPLAQSNALTRELKAAFADALTWAPDYPGIGRIPRVHGGVADVARLEAHDLEAMAHNMLADERGRRTFVVGHDALELLDGVPRIAHREHEGASLTVRGRFADESAARACSELAPAIVTAVLGLRARAFLREVSKEDGGGFAVDLVAARERPRGAHAPAVAMVIVLDDMRALMTGSPLARLANGGVLALPTGATSPDQLWADVPPYAKAVVFDRHAKVVGWGLTKEEATSPLAWAGAFTGLALAMATPLGRTAVDASLVAREVFEIARNVLVNGTAPSEEKARVAAEAARRAFGDHIEVPGTLVEKDEESIRLGRRDARAAALLER